MVIGINKTDGSIKEFKEDEMSSLREFKKLVNNYRNELIGLYNKLDKEED